MLVHVSSLKREVVVHFESAHSLSARKRNTEVDRLYKSEAVLIFTPKKKSNHRKLHLSRLMCCDPYYQHLNLAQGPGSRVDGLSRDLASMI